MYFFITNSNAHELHIRKKIHIFMKFYLDKISYQYLRLFLKIRRLCD